MKRSLLSLFVAAMLFSCETEVDPSLSDPLNLLVVDAWLTNQGTEQHINITRSQAYFDETAPPKVSGASVIIRDLSDATIAPYVFNETSERYTWESPDGNPFGIIGHQYELEVIVEGNSYTSIAMLNDVPPIDSVTFRLEEETAFFDDLIFAEFFATDLPGINDSYWIKTWRNGAFLGNPDEINIAYDAAFSVDIDNDNVQFIQPIRDAVNPFLMGDENDILSPYNLPDTLLVSNDSLYRFTGEFYGVIDEEEILFDEQYFDEDFAVADLNDDQFTLRNDSLFIKGDSLYVEIHSISNEAYFFMNQVIIETTREGGFGALFATPLANVSTNIVPDDPENRVAGFFNIAAVSGAGRRLNTAEEIRILP